MTSLLEDGGLLLAAPACLDPAVAAWLPRFHARAAAPHPTPARIELRREVQPSPAQERTPDFELLPVCGWIEAGEQVALVSEGGIVGGRIDLRQQVGTLAIPPGTPSNVLSHHLFCALTAATGLLLTRQRRLLLHAGAVADPDGRAWVLPGDSFSGKSSTCVTLMRGGWRFLADDQVVLTPWAAGVRVEGWVRPFQLDTGYLAGSPTGVRAPVDPQELNGAGWCASAPLGGLLFPRVEADRPTVLEPTAQVDALCALLRQSPWLMADPVAASDVLSLLVALVQRPIRLLRLGRDSYNRPDVLMSVLAPVVAA